MSTDIFNEDDPWGEERKEEHGKVTITPLIPYDYPELEESLKFWRGFFSESKLDDVTESGKSHISRLFHDMKSSGMFPGLTRENTDEII